MILRYNNNNNNPEWQCFNVAGYLIEERRRWPVITASHEDNALNSEFGRKGMFR